MNKKLLILISVILNLLFFNNLNAQCPISENPVLINSFVESAPTVSDCSVFIESSDGVFSGETFMLSGITSGQTYVVDLCNAIVWDATLTVYDADSNLVVFDDGSASGCGMGARATFTAASSGTYFITVAKPDCGIDLSANGKIKVFNNTDGISPCPASTNIPCSLNATFLSGSASTGVTQSAIPVGTCATDWQAEDNPFPPMVYVAMGPFGDFSNQPYEVSTSVGRLFSTSNLNDASSADTLNNGLAVLLGLTQEELDADTVEVIFRSLSNETCSDTLLIPSDFLTTSIADLCPSESFDCMANVGSITPPSNTMYTQDDTAEAPSVSGQNTTGDYAYLYVLTTDLDTSDVIDYNIVATSETGAFDFAELGLEVGVYNVHGLSYNTSIGLPDNLTSGEEVFGLISADIICGDLSLPAYTLTVDLGSSLNEPIHKTEFKLYPIPSISNLNIDVASNETDFLQWYVYDLSGRFIRSDFEHIYVGHNTFQIDVSDLVEGVYFLELEGNSGIYTKRFIKE